MLHAHSNREVQRGMMMGDIQVEREGKQVDRKIWTDWFRKYMMDDRFVSK